MKHTTSYLYAIQPSELINMPYKEALEYKVSNGIKNRKRTARIAGRVRRPSTIYTLLTRKYLDIDKAIKFNKELIDELQ